MTVLTIEDFKFGLDTRKSVLTAEAGSLVQLDNCIITPGGEIQKCMAFYPVFTLPPGTTKGLHGTASGNAGTEQLFVFSCAAGGAGAITQLGTIGYRIVNATPVYQYNLNPPASGPANLTWVDRVAEYGITGNYPNLFVAAITGGVSPPFDGQMNNWWNGAQLTSYVGAEPVVSGQKMYRASGPILYFSGVGDPSDCNPLNSAGTGPNTVHPGAGFIDMTTMAAGTRFISGLELYYKQLAVFTQRNCLLWAMNADPSQNAFQQVLETGTPAGRSIRKFGTGDVLFLAHSGVRSLRVLNASLAAAVTDVGSPIDSLIQAALASNPAIVATAKGIIEPLTGRYWLTLGNTIYILSYWPSAKINAWSTVTLPFQIDDITTAGDRIFLRSGDTIYAYGGTSANLWDNSLATVTTPLHAAGTPMTKKKAVSIGAMLSGNWTLGVCMDPDNPTAFETCANLAGSTYAKQTVPFSGFASHIGFQLTTTDAAPSTIGSLSCRFEKSTEL